MTESEAISKGRKLFDKSVKYLESQGFEDCDFSTFFLPSNKGDDQPGIGLGYEPNSVSICAISPLLERSEWMTVSSYEQAVKILYLLVFTIKEWK